MPLLDRIRHSFKDRVKRRRQGLDESNIFGNGSPSTEGSHERTSNYFENARLFEAQKSEYLSPYPFYTLDNVNDDVDDDGDNEESCITDCSSENFVARFISESISTGCSNAFSPRLRSRSHHIQQETALSNQRMRDSQQGNHNVCLDSDSHKLAEDLEVFGSPLERVKARSSHPCSGWGMQYQIDPHMGEDVEQQNLSSRTGHSHSEDRITSNESSRTDSLRNFSTLHDVQMLHRHRKPKRMTTPKPWYLPSENPHRQVGVYDGVFFNHVSKILIFEENV